MAPWLHGSMAPWLHGSMDDGSMAPWLCPHQYKSTESWMTSRERALRMERDERGADETLRLTSSSPPSRSLVGKR
ncbi:hypothetical protein EYF80_065922 [Liparis tanakae]|uniref:Uncharacterized protein n=1 Tax=Liparis tanakae TaxID=230148 RepID=A0A4Z2E5S0_9TELE|nr:hypothetical protein EYF80_065922 [Liparis tanakae]